MISAASKKRLATAIAGAAVASALAVSGASAHHGSVGSQGAGATPDMPPPPSSIAVSAAEEYGKLRSAGAADTASRPVVETATATGFDLPSAALGAAGGTGLVIALLTAGAVVRSHRRVRFSR